MQEHLQNLMGKGFMTVMELTTCHMLEDLVSPAPTEGYVVSFVVFYERGLDVPSHRFLCSLLQHYRLELHNLILWGILHIAVFMTLWEAYMGIDPYFDLWNYFSCVRRPQDPNVVLMVLGGVVIHVKTGHGVNSYFDIPMPKLMKGWWKQWFYLRNNTDAPLPVFTSNCPTAQQN
jgi:hypothetical protein